ncbi:MAG: B3/B4 domain-containing protein [Bacteroidales bacterium]
MNKINITISDEVKSVAPEYRGVAIVACVTNSCNNEELWKKIAEEELLIRQNFKMDQINKRPEILATRNAYKALGKDPNRYRPSAEALCRRVVKELPLYRISVLVDLINLISIKYGYSIGGFDADLIAGDLELGVGQSGELFRAIGRGELNIEGLPVFRDQVGPVGTPTSDEERTQLRDHTSTLLMIINGYEGGLHFNTCVAETLFLLKQFASMTSFEVIKI